MTKSSNDNEPYVNPIALRLSQLVFIASIITAIVMIVRGVMSQRENFNTTIYIVLAVATGVVSLLYTNRLTKAREIWMNKQTLKIDEEKELTIEDQFIFSRIYRSADVIYTHLFYYIISQDALYQIHPYEDEKYVRDNLGIASVIKARITHENGQRKVLEYDVVYRGAPREIPNAGYEATGVITEKFFGFAPSGRETTNKLSFHNVITDPQQKQMSSDVHVVLEQRVLQSTRNGKNDKFYICINSHVEQVSMEDFMKFKMGDRVTFKRDEQIGLSTVTLG